MRARSASSYEAQLTSAYATNDTNSGQKACKSSNEALSKSADVTTWRQCAKRATQLRSISSFSRLRASHFSGTVISSPLDSRGVKEDKGSSAMYLLPSPNQAVCGAYEHPQNERLANTTVRGVEQAQAELWIYAYGYGGCRRTEWTCGRFKLCRHARASRPFLTPLGPRPGICFRVKMRSVRTPSSEIYVIHQAR